MGNLPILRGVRLSAGYVALVPTRVLDPADPVTQRVGGVIWHSDGLGWRRVTEPMKRVRLVSHVARSEDIVADIQSIDVSRTALVNSDIAALSGPPGIARVVTDRPGWIVVETMAPGRQLLVLTERFHEGWHVTEDGEPRPVVRVFGDYLGCVIASGTRRVEFRFAPASLQTGTAISAAGIALTVLATWLVGRRRGSASA